MKIDNLEYMKPKRLQILEKILRLMAIIVLKKYNPQIIGITGSVGKTSAKEAVFLAVSGKFRTRKNIKNYNNEIGIPLTIIGAESGSRSFFKWLKVFFKWLIIVLFPLEYPEVIVLEMGVDRPGDMKRLTDFIPVKIGIVTVISSSHLEFFKGIDQIAKEKGKIIEDLPRGGIAILNVDDELVSGMMEGVESEAISYGFSEGAQVRATNVVSVFEDGKPQGLSFKLDYQGKSVPVRLPHIIAPHQIYAVLAGVSAGIAMKINLVDIAKALDNFSPPPGRMNILQGAKESMIIDDTYNSSPKSSLAAFETIEKIKSSRKIAVLGDMLELGKEEEAGHKEIARKIFAMNVDIFFAVGDRMKIAVCELERLGYPKEKIFWFENPGEAGTVLLQKIKPGDLILVKGSQGMRMEKIVEKIMAEPAKGRNFLCRQSKEWWKKPYNKP